MPEILKRIENDGGWKPTDFESRKEGSDDKTQVDQEDNQEEYEIVWQQSIGALIEPATSMIQAINDGLEHSALRLEIVPRPGTKNFLNWMPGAKRTAKSDAEAEGETIKPGNPEFSKILEENLYEFSAGRIEALNAWADSKGLSQAQIENLQALDENGVYRELAGDHIQRDRQQLYLILYVQHTVRKRHII